MVDFVVDKALDVLKNQLDEHAPNRSKASDGSIGDAAHQSRDSAHNPEDTEDSMDHNDPDNQVDARDFTHDPAHGADMREFTEQLRLSHDPRLYLVIFDGRQFSSYAKNGIPPFTWRPYTGKDMHRGHAHVEVNDYHNDDTRPWEVYVATIDQKYLDNITATDARVRTILANQDEAVYKINGVERREPNVLKQALTALGLTLRDVSSDLDALVLPPVPAVDPETLQPVVEAGVRAVLKAGVDQA